MHLFQVSKKIQDGYKLLCTICHSLLIVGGCSEMVDGSNKVSQTMKYKSAFDKNANEKKCK